MGARLALVRDYPQLKNNLGLLDQCVADVGFDELAPVDQLFLGAMIFDRLGDFFQGSDVYFTDPETLKQELERFLPTFEQFSTRDLLRGLRQILRGNYPGLEYAPNPYQFGQAIKAFQQRIPAYCNNLSLCPPISDAQLSYYFPDPEQRAQYRANTIERDSTVQALDQQEAQSLRHKDVSLKQQG
jgi:hypothetical protein